MQLKLFYQPGDDAQVARQISSDMRKSSYYVISLWAYFIFLFEYYEPAFSTVGYGAMVLSSSILLWGIYSNQRAEKTGNPVDDRRSIYAYIVASWLHAVLVYEFCWLLPTDEWVAITCALAIQSILVQARVTTMNTRYFLLSTLPGYLSYLAAALMELAHGQTNPMLSFSTQILLVFFLCAYAMHIYLSRNYLQHQRDYKERELMHRSAQHDIRNITHAFVHQITHEIATSSDHRYVQKLMQFNRHIKSIESITSSVLAVDPNRQESTEVSEPLYLLHELHALIFTEFYKKGIFIHIDSRAISEGVVVHVPPMVLHRCFYNILMNAADAYAGTDLQTKPVYIRLVIEQDELSISFSDLAGGISESVLPKIFIKGFSTKSSNVESAVRGIGLSSAQESLKPFGCSLDIRSTQGKGTTATVNIPASCFVSNQTKSIARQAVEVQLDPHSAEQVVAVASALKGQRGIYIEDFSDLAFFTKLSMEEIAECEVDLFNPLEDQMDLERIRGVDFIISDLTAFNHLDERDALIELISLLKIPFLIVTGDDTLSLSTAKSYVAHIQLLYKPCEIEQMVEAIVLSHQEAGRK